MHRRFQHWVRSKVLEGVLLAVAQDLKDGGGIDLRDCFINGTFVPAKKGGSAWEELSVGRAADSWRSRTENYVGLVQLACVVILLRYL